MITPGLSLKKALLLSLVFHAILVITTLPRFHRQSLRYWMVTPIELVSLPAADTAIPQSVKPAAPVREKKKPNEEKNVKEKKAEVKKDRVVINPKKKKTGEKPQPQLKEIPQPVPAAAPAPAPAAPVKTQSTAIMPDVRDFPFLYYLKIIQKKITANWNFDYEGAGRQKVVVFFKIDKDGKVYDQKVEQSSGILFLDQSALRAVLLSSPFPSLPAEYSGNFLGVHFGFEFKKEG